MTVLSLGELVRTHNSSNKAEIARIIADDCQGKGLGSQMLDQLIAIGSERGFSRLLARFDQGNPAIERMRQQSILREVSLSAAKLVVVELNLTSRVDAIQMLVYSN